MGPEVQQGNETYHRDRLFLYLQSSSFPISIDSPRHISRRLYGDFPQLV